MKPYDYLPDLGEHGSLRGKRTWVKPAQFEKYSLGEYLYGELTNRELIECENYNNYLLSLPTYPCTKELGDWMKENPKEGYERDVDFVIDGNIAGRKFPYYEKAMDDMREAEKDAMKEREDELWEEAERIIRTMIAIKMPNMKSKLIIDVSEASVNYLRKQFSITRKRKP